ncbi:MAG: hypothetical protein ABI193_17620, partial [Minicystis sp.]
MGTRNTNVDRVDLEDILPDLHAIASEADPARRDRKLRALCDSGVDMAERLSDPELVAHASRNSDIDLRSILPDLKALAHEARATRRDEGAVVPAVRERPLPKTPWQRRRLVALAVLAV